MRFGICLLTRRVSGTKETTSHLKRWLCKLFGLEAVGRVTDRGLLVHGGIGYTRKTPIERLYRDARLNWLEEGPPTIQYLVAARELAGGFEWNDAFSG